MILVWARRGPGLPGIFRLLFGEGSGPAATGAAALPIPPHFEAGRVGQLWLVPHAAREHGARPWAAEHAIAPAANDRVRVHLVLVGASNRFCIPESQEFVAGTSGRAAVDDTARLCAFMYRNLRRITSITAVLAARPGAIAGAADACVPVVEEAVLFLAAARQTAPTVVADSEADASVMIECDVLLVAGQPMDGGVAAILASLASAARAAGRAPPRIVLLEDCTSARVGREEDVEALLARLGEQGVERVRSTSPASFDGGGATS